MQPSVGRIVHYVSYGTVDLAVLNPTGMFFNQGVMADHTENQGGTWHWPEQVG